MDINQTVSTPELQGILKYASVLPKFLTEKTTFFLTNHGFKVSERWSGLLFFGISLGLFYVGIKITQPLIKWLLVMISIVIFVGLIIPW